MSDVAIFKTGKTPIYLTSVNTPDYEDDPDVIVNPDISEVQDIPLEHWKRKGNEIVEMSPVEKNTLDTEKAAKELIIKNEQIDRLDVSTAELAEGLIALGIVDRHDLVNAIKGL